MPTEILRCAQNDKNALRGRRVPPSILDSHRQIPQREAKGRYSTVAAFLNSSREILPVPARSRSSFGTVIMSLEGSGDYAFFGLGVCFLSAPALARSSRAWSMALRASASFSLLK